MPANGGARDVDTDQRQAGLAPKAVGGLRLRDATRAQVALSTSEARFWLNREIEIGCRALDLPSDLRIIGETRAWIMRNPEIFRESMNNERETVKQKQKKRNR